MRRYREHGKPSEALAVLALAAGGASLLPLLAPFAALIAALASLCGLFLSSRYPEKHAGRRKIHVALCLCLLGMGLFFAEGALFWRWKIRQAYGQRVAVTRLRLDQVAQALEQYRQERGTYPDLSGIMRARAELVPKYSNPLPVLDGFGGAISVLSHPDGFTVMAQPPAPPGSELAPPPLVTKGEFQPAPAPPPPAEPFPGDTQEPPAGEIGREGVRGEEKRGEQEAGIEGRPEGDNKPAEPPRLPRPPSLPNPDAP